VVGTGDFNADGKADILWQNVNGSVAIWEMNGTTPIAETVVQAVTPDWHVVGTGDFNADGKADIVWQNAASGQAAVWLMNGSSPTLETLVGQAPGPDWHLLAG
jgi:hypothetical protein